MTKSWAGPGTGFSVIMDNNMLLKSDLLAGMWIYADCHKLVNDERESKNSDKSYR
jgi:hypothetical protein